MYESIKPIVIVLFCLFLTTPLFCQNSISYSYDDAGNRIARVISGNISSIMEKPYGFHKVTIMGRIMQARIVRVLEEEWQSDFMRVDAHKSSPLELDIHIEDYPIHIKPHASKKIFDQFAIVFPKLQGISDSIRLHEYEIR